MKVHILLAGIFLFVSDLETIAQDDPKCPEPDTTISGSVLAGASYEARLSPDLIFRLQPQTHPQNPQGWTITVTDTVGGNDFVMVATPPYRFSNPRYLDTSYGTTAVAAVAWTPRNFQFVLNRKDFALMHEAVGTLLWPSGSSEDQLVAAGTVLSQVRKGSGEFSIASSQTSPATDEFPLGRIEALRFEVDFCLPGIDGK